MSTLKTLCSLSNIIPPFQQKRLRKILVHDFFKILILSVLSNTGVKTLVNSLKCFNPSNFYRFRNKISDNYFQKLNTLFQKTYCDAKNNNQCPNIYFLDASKVHVKAGLKNVGYKSRTNDIVVKRKAIRPILMLSVLVSETSDSIFDFQISKHFNERTSALEHLKILNKKDIVIMDRGYFSKSLYHEVHKKGIFGVFRVKNDANKEVSSFVKSKKSDIVIHLPIIDRISNTTTFLKIRYLKYTVQGSLFIIATNIFDKSIDYLASLYKKRWRVELSFKRLKSQLCIEKIFSLSEKCFLQDLHFRILLDSILRTQQLKNLNDSDTKQSENKNKNKNKINDNYRSFLINNFVLYFYHTFEYYKFFKAKKKWK